MTTTTDIAVGSGVWRAIAPDGVTVTAPATATDPLKISIDYSALSLFDSLGHGIQTIDFVEPAGNADNFGIRLDLVVEVTNSLGVPWDGFVLYQANETTPAVPDTVNVHPTNYAHFHNVLANSFPGLTSEVLLQDFISPAALGPVGVTPAPGQIQASGTLANGATTTSNEMVLHQYERAGIDDNFSISFFPSLTSGQQIVALDPANLTVTGPDVGTFSFDVLRSGSADAVNSTTTSVSYSILGSGTNPADASDFVGGVLPSGTLNFAAGDTSETISFDVTGQTASKLDETFIVQLSGAAIGTAIGIIGTAGGTIQHVDVPIPDAIDWEALSAKVLAYYEETGQWGDLNSWIDTGNPWP